MRRVKAWYLILLGLWAVLAVPGWVGGVLYGGGYSPPKDWPSLLIDLAFVLPLLLLAVGIRKRTR